MILLCISTPFPKTLSQQHCHKSMAGQRSGADIDALPRGARNRSKSWKSKCNNLTLYVHSVLLGCVTGSTAGNHIMTPCAYIQWLSKAYTNIAPPGTYTNGPAPQGAYTNSAPATCSVAIPNRWELTYTPEFNHSPMGGRIHKRAGTHRAPQLASHAAPVPPLERRYRRSATNRTTEC